jgi:hypothetical protein
LVVWARFPPRRRRLVQPGQRQDRLRGFTRYFHKPQPRRTLEEIRADILALEKETEGLLSEIIGSCAWATIPTDITAGRSAEWI